MPREDIPEELVVHAARWVRERDEARRAVERAFAALTDRSLTDGIARARAGVILQDALRSFQESSDAT